MSKVIIITMLLIGLVGMIGTAAADSITIYDTGTSTPVSEIKIAPGGSVEKDLVITAFLNTGPIIHTLSDDVYNSAGNPTDDIIIEYLEVTSIPIWDEADYEWTQESGSNSETLKIKFSVPGSVSEGAVYTIYIDDTAAGVPRAVTVSVKATTEIPEFPTIALPVAAILGLMFIISSRKKEE